MVGSFATERLINSVAFVGIAAILLVGVCITKWPIYWRITVAIHFFDAVNAAVWRLSSVTDSTQWLHMPDAIYLRSLPIFGGVAIALLVVATTIDLYKKEYRNWQHWTGLLYEFVHWYWIVSVYLR